MSETSHDLLARMDPTDVGVLAGPGGLRDKWPRLTPGGKELLELALAAAGNELVRVTELAGKAGLLTPPVPAPTRPTTAPSVDPAGPTPPGSASSR